MALDDDLRRLLDSYVEPCVGGCDHSQCPLLRELHALRIKASLERARLTVKPIVDKEREGEAVGNLMNMSLDATTVPEAGAVVAARDIISAFPELTKHDNWATLGRVTIDRETETESFERSTAPQLSAQDRIAAIISKHCSAAK